MKTKTTILFAVILLLFFITTRAQVVLYGMTSMGGVNNSGTIFSITPSGNLKTICALNSTYAAYPYGSLLYASDGNFYASSVDGGYADSCTIFCYTHSGNLKTIINLDSVWGLSLPQGNNLIQALDGNLYGMTTYGGPLYGQGVLFKLQLNGQYKALHFFNDTDGAYPYGSLIQTADSNLWGMTSVGGGTDSSAHFGNIFHCTPSGTFTSVFRFNDTNGAVPYGDLLLANDNNFYGLTSQGGKYGYGTLFRYTPSGTFTKLLDFNDTNGATPYGSLIQATDGKLYGLTSQGGDSGHGTLFSCTLAGTLTKLVNFGIVNGSMPYGTLMQASDGNLYGMTYEGGKYYYGTVFQCSLSGHLTKIADFDYTNNGSSPMYGKLIEEDTAHFAIDTTHSDTIATGINKIANANSIRIYPNPNTGSFTLAFSHPSGQSKVEVFNMLGSKVYDGMLMQTQHNEQINLGIQPDGLYFYRVLDENGNLISNGKLIIQK
jgi:uncharacterized repeat protein (TIGR03803 family)